MCGNNVVSFLDSLQQVYFQPYFMLYGEVFATDIDPPCGGPGEKACITGTNHL